MDVRWESIGVVSLVVGHVGRLQCSIGFACARRVYELPFPCRAECSPEACTLVSADYARIRDVCWCEYVKTKVCE